jgi:DNA topoisomerase-2
MRKVTARKPAARKDARIEQYAHMNTRDHVLSRPGAYAMSVDPFRHKEWMWDPTSSTCQLSETMTPLGLSRSFVEIANNLTDEMRKAIKKGLKPKIPVITIDKTTVTMTNTHASLPIAKMKWKGGARYIPEVMFGCPRSSSNYNSDEDQEGVGTYGLGAKATNIFSRYFEIYVEDVDNQLSYNQVWKNNMIAEDPIIKSKACRYGLVTVTYQLDFKRFSVKGYSEQHLNIFYRHCIDMSFHSQSIIKFNDIDIDYRDLKTYLAVYFGSFTKVLTFKCATSHGSIRGGLTVYLVDSLQANILSFVNGSFTSQQGCHVSIPVKKISTIIRDCFNKSLPEGARKMTIREVKLNLAVMVLADVEAPKPSFSNAQKSELVGPELDFNPENIKQVEGLIKWECMKTLKNISDAMRRKVLAKIDGKKIKNLPAEYAKKLEDAEWAGTSRSSEAVLFIVEGGSAGSYPRHFMKLMPYGRLKYGILGSGGKIINPAKYENNPEKLEKSKIIKLFNAAMGTQYGVDYSNPKNIAKLRYGQIIIMTDQDHDGSHIKGLFYNMIYRIHPTLLESGIISTYRTPITRVYFTNGDKLSFYTDCEFEKWKAESGHKRKWTSKHFKGLGTSKQSDVQEDLMNNDNNITYEIDDQAIGYIDLAFRPELANDRKNWIVHYQQLEDHYYQVTDGEKLSNFFINEFITFMIMSLRRAINHQLDGMKHCHRQIIWTCIRNALMNKGKEVKVVQFIGYVLTEADYEHGDAALYMSIVHLCQNFPGSNNLPLMEPIGNFGDRENGGSNPGGARYISVAQTRWQRYVFMNEDLPLLKFREVGQDELAEPDFLLPIIPLHIINGVDGIACGWRTKIVNHNPLTVIDSLMYYLKSDLGEATGRAVELVPFYRFYDGEISVSQPDNVEYYVMTSQGRYQILNEHDDDTYTVVITELPIGVAPVNYKIQLVKWREAGLIKEFIYKCLSDEVMIIVKGLNLTENGDEERDGDEEEYPDRTNQGDIYYQVLAKLKLRLSRKLTNINHIDDDGRVHNYQNIYQSLDEFYQLRLKFYELRRLNLIKLHQTKLDDKLLKHKFYRLIIEGELEVRDVPEEQIIRDMAKHELPIGLYRKTKLPAVNKNNMTKIEAIIAEHQKLLEYYQAIEPERLWLIDLAKLKEVLQSKSVIDDINFYYGRIIHFTKEYHSCLREINKSTGNLRGRKKADEEELSQADYVLLSDSYQEEIQFAITRINRARTRERRWSPKWTQVKDHWAERIQRLKDSLNFMKSERARLMKDYKLDVDYSSVEDMIREELATLRKR